MTNSQYHDGINIHGDLYLSIDNSLYVVNKTYGTLSPVYQGTILQQLQYEEVNNLLFGIYNQTLYVLKTSPFSVQVSYTMPDDIIFYDFVYE